MAENNTPWQITHDFKYVYFYYQYERIVYRISNISSKPIHKRHDRIKRVRKLKDELMEVMHGKKVIYK